MTWLIDWMPETWIRAFGWSLIHAIWQGAAVAAALWLVHAFSKNHSAWTRYLWSLGALMAVPVLWAATFLRLLDWEPVSGPVSASMTTMPVLSMGPGSLIDAVANGVPSRLEPFLPAIVGFWLIGQCLLAFRHLGGAVYAYRLKTRAVRALGGTWNRRLQEMVRDLGIRKAVGLFESAMIKTPMVIGHFKPVILLPLGAVTGLSTKELEGILLHELGHILRRDYLINWFQAAVEILFFYHPAVWWISARARDEREHCCDELAVARSGDPLSLAKALTHLEEARMQLPQTVLALIGGKNHLLSRIRRMSGFGISRPGRLERFAVAVVSSVCLLTILSACAALGTSSRSISQTAEQSDSGKSTIFYSNTHNGGDRDVVIRTERGEIVEILENGKAIPESQWGTYRDIMEIVKKEQAVIRENEQRLHEVEESLHRHEEVLAEQEKMARAQEEVMRKREAIAREQEEAMREMERSMKKNEEETRKYEAATEKEMEAIHNKNEAILRRKEQLMKEHEERLRSVERKLEEIDRNADGDDPSSAKRREEALRQMEKSMAEHQAALEKMDHELTKWQENAHTEAYQKSLESREEAERRMALAHKEYEAKLRKLERNLEEKERIALREQEEKLRRQEESLRKHEISLRRHEDKIHAYEDRIKEFELILEKKFKERSIKSLRIESEPDGQ